MQSQEVSKHLKGELAIVTEISEGMKVKIKKARKVKRKNKLRDEQI